MIIHLQALLGNRTNNDIKNYWNTYLKKKLNKLQTGSPETPSREGLSFSQTMSKGQWERRLQMDIRLAKKALSEAISPAKKLFISSPKQVQASTTYASSVDNITKLLKNWTKNPPKRTRTSSTPQCLSNRVAGTDSTSSCIELFEAFNSLFGFESFDSSNSDFSQPMSPDGSSLFQDESKPDPNSQLPLSLFEQWLFDEGVVATQGKEQLLLSDIIVDENANFFSF
ncbi:hypothetical protein UlMin_021308 [Ulmus minor]